MSKKKKSKSAIPKRIAGVKVPKALRKSGGSALLLAQTPIIKKVIGSGLVAAAAAIAGAQSGEKTQRKAKDALKALKRGDTEELGDALSAAVNSAITQWIGGSIDRHQGKVAGEPGGAISTQH